ncbi:MAG: hypothetical protein SFV52_11950 [Saprospiraceae bacterium]|nr:hypothetical protein [Saprospiraceae bacterium]
MARLTGFSRLLITLAIVAGVFFLIRTFLPQLTEQFGGKTGTTTEQPASPATDEQGGGAAASAPAPPSGGGGGAMPFRYQPPAPVNGKLKGVVEMGATGFNSFIITIDNDKNWKLEKAEFGASLVYEKLATDTDIKNGLKNYIADMLAFGVPAKDIHFVISSGAKKVAITSKISGMLKGMGYNVNEVKPEQEARYALRSAMPPVFDAKSFVVDIGSGNTKISWVSGSGVRGLDSYGAKYFQDKTPDATVYNDVKAKCGQVPASLRSTCFIIGGVPFELAKQTRNGKERYTVLNMPDQYTAQGEKQKAGLNIYKAVADATGCKQFVFDWDANFTIGFLLSL